MHRCDARALIAQPAAEKPQHGGLTELFGYPMQTDGHGDSEPPSTMPEVVRERFTQAREKAEKRLAEAGHQNGSSVKVQVCSCAPPHIDPLEMLSGNVQQVGVKVQIQTLDYAAFFSAMLTKDAVPDARMVAKYAERSEAKRQQMLEDMNRDLIAPSVWRPTAKGCSAWSPG